jgi:hypothetical protein
MFILDYILGEFRAIANAPLAFLSAAIAAAAVIYLLTKRRHAGIVASKDAEIARLTEQRDEYREMLDGDSPAEAKARIQALEEQIANFVGSTWDPLTRAEIQNLTELFARLPKQKVLLQHANLGKDLAQSIGDAFNAAGWQNHVQVSKGSGLGYGLSIGPADGVALSVKKALERATNHELAPLESDEKDIEPKSIRIAIGIRV